MQNNFKDFWKEVTVPLRPWGWVQDSPIDQMKVTLLLFLELSCEKKFTPKISLKNLEKWSFRTKTKKNKKKPWALWGPYGGWRPWVGLLQLFWKISDHLLYSLDGISCNWQAIGWVEGNYVHCGADKRSDLLWMLY